mgnify:CR=1 FL=1
MPEITPLIRFPQSLFPQLRNRLLKDSSREAFALLLGKRITVDGGTIIKVLSAHYPGPNDYISQDYARLHLKREYIYDRLVDMQQNGEADTLIDVHTHPFSYNGVSFSAIDDNDEQNFCTWLHDTLDDIHYASIVLSHSDYSARHWEWEGETPVAHNARIKAQIVSENWPAADFKNSNGELNENLENGFLARSVLALGLDTLRQITTDQTIGIIGVGGLGSIIAENLVHSGFNSLHLIDPDHVELTNLNRIVGAYYCDAQLQKLKVDAVRDHLERINPCVDICAHPHGIEDPSLLPYIMQCDWLLVTTDNHFSRFKAQEIALQLGIPLISSGVNITVEDGRITDMSGEVIIARYGDNLCLNCLGRINPIMIAAEQNPESFIAQELVRKGYVAGLEVKDPAVKTLNAILGAMTVDVLVNQFTLRQEHKPIIVYENNDHISIYEETDSVKRRNILCYSCN